MIRLLLVTGKKLIDLILVSLSTLVALGSLGIFIYTTLIYERPLPDDTQEKLALIQSGRAQSFPESYRLEKITINLPGTTTRLRFLDVEIHLIPFFPAQTRLFEEHQALIIDTIITVAGGMSPDELNTALGRLLLEKRIIDQVHEKVGQKIIQDIFYSRFVVQ